MTGAILKKKNKKGKRCLSASLTDPVQKETNCVYFKLLIENQDVF